AYSGPEGEPGKRVCFSTSPDDQWRITKAGEYKLTFDLEHRTIAAQYIGNAQGGGGDERAPIESETLYMIGDATPGGWSMDDATAFTRSESDGYTFTWQGTLAEGNMKACLQPDGTFSCPFLRPSSAGVEIGPDGVAAPDFVYTTSPDDQWHITKAGRYSITFNLKEWTIEAKYLD
ncbi:MAG: SusF/SusE family outer membrane protein, partial [Muribaculaceae bacterium]|nr:SusF/SusE family outer membrane protein [Muribaculaceae bacterium]